MHGLTFEDEGLRIGWLQVFSSRWLYFDDAVVGGPETDIAGLSWRFAGLGRSGLI
jgi:hypothetical protein